MYLKGQNWRILLGWNNSILNSQARLGTRLATRFFFTCKIHSSQKVAQLKIEKKSKNGFFVLPDAWISNSWGKENEETLQANLSPDKNDLWWRMKSKLRRFCNLIYFEKIVWPLKKYCINLARLLECTLLHSVQGSILATRGCFLVPNRRKIGFKF